MRIGTRISFGFAGVLALTGLVGGIGWTGLHGYDRGVADARLMTNLAHEASNVQIQFAVFERDGDQASLQATAGMLAKLIDHIGNTIPQASSEVATALRNIDAELKAYQATMAAYDRLHATMKLRQAHMQEVAERIRAIAADVNAGNEKLHQASVRELENVDVAQQTRRELRDQASLLIQNMLQARQGETVYRWQREPQAKAATLAAMKEIFLISVRMRKLAAGTNDETPVAKLAQSVNRYRKAFGDVFAAVEDGASSATADRGLDNVSKQMRVFVNTIAARQEAAYQHVATKALVARAAVGRAVQARADAQALVSQTANLQLAQGSFAAAPTADAAGRVAEALALAKATAARLSGSMTAESQAAAGLEGLLPAYEEAFAAYRQAVAGQIDARRRMSAAQANVVAICDAAIAEATSAMQALHRFGVTAIILCVLGALGAGTVISMVTARSITRPLRGLTHSVARLAKGDPAAVIPALERADELGDMARSMEVIRETGTAAVRAQETLENAGAAMIMVDPDGQITHANRAFKRLVETARNDVGAELSGFTAETIEGLALERFHNLPQLQPISLMALTSETSCLLAAAGRTFELQLNPVFSDGGGRLGTVIEWWDQSQRLQVERDVEAMINAAATGQFGQRLATAGLDGFLLVLSDSINRLVAAVDLGIKECVAMMAALATGDLTCAMRGDHHGAFGRLQDDSAAMQLALTGIVRRIHEASEALRQAADEIASGSTDLASRTDAQASFLRETAASMANVANMVKQNTAGAEKANDIAVSARSSANAGDALVGRAVAAMARIQTSSTRVTEIVDVIDDIAFQTNLLALNAAVEAARAGETGKGFAVVASEVRSLAQRSATASKQISELIAATVQEIGDGVDLVREVGDGLGSIRSAVNALADLVADIAAASQDQARRLAEVSEAVSSMDQVTQQNAALVEQTSASVRSQVDQVNQLKELLGFFRLGAEPNPTTKRAEDKGLRLAS